LTTSTKGSGGVQRNNTLSVYPALSSVVLTAIPNADSKFIQWSNGNKLNPMTLVIDHNTNLVAQFAPSNELLEQNTFTNTMGKWYFWSDATIQATNAIANSEVCINSKEIAQDWQVQIAYPNLNLQNGTNYDLSFNARASSSARPIRISLVNDETDANISVSFNASIGVSPQIYTHSFTTTNSARPARLEFDLGQDTTNVCFTEISLRQRTSTTPHRTNFGYKIPHSGTTLSATPNGIVIQNVDRLGVIRNYNIQGQKATK
jgi:hypothetical protein